VFTAAGREARSRGVHQVLGPVLDVARDPRWGRFEECYGEDPYLVSRMGMAATFGLQGRGPAVDTEHVAVTLKHFAGHGQPEGGRNIAPVNYSEREFRSVHLYPFEMAVKAAHAHALMASYNEWDRVPNHVNHRLLTDILRTEWGFDGFVMSDGGGIESVVDEHHAAAGYAEAGILCIEAGVDFGGGGKGRCFSMEKHLPFPPPPKSTPASMHRIPASAYPAAAWCSSTTDSMPPPSDITKPSKPHSVRRMSVRSLWFTWFGTRSHSL